MEYLVGGRVNQIALIGETVHRPAGKWTPTVYKLLHHVRSQGFLGAPEPLGFDNEGNEIVSYISGEVSNYPLSESASTLEALVSAAELLRSYHDASESFTGELQGDESWMLPAREPFNRLNYPANQPQPQTAPSPSRPCRRLKAWSSSDAGPAR